jgi:hypothetical protein
MMFRCVAAIPNTGGNCLEHFYPDTPDGFASAEVFAQQYNRDGWGVYDCVSPLREERRAKDTVAQIVGLHWDLDARQLKESKEEIIEKTRAKPSSRSGFSRASRTAAVVCTSIPSSTSRSRRQRSRPTWHIGCCAGWRPTWVPIWPQRTSPPSCAVPGR